MLVYLLKNNFNAVQTAFPTYSDFSWEAPVHKSLDNRHPAVLYKSFCTCGGQNTLMDLILFSTNNLCIFFPALQLCLNIHICHDEYKHARAEQEISA